VSGSRLFVNCSGPPAANPKIFTLFVATNIAETHTRIGVSATTKINRKDYGPIWNTALETGGILVGEEVTITLDLQFVKS
jgi:polyisoprenoid-binding protein YceI